MINRLGLPIYLRMISIVKAKLSSYPWSQTLQEITYEIYIPIWSDGPRNSMQINHLIKVKLGNLRCIHGLSVSYEMGHLWESINNNKIRVYCVWGKLNTKSTLTSKNKVLGTANGVCNLAFVKASWDL
jgi:hypothetical protein